MDLETQNLKEIDLSRHCSDDWFTINAYQPSALIEAGLVGGCDNQSINRLTNHLQVSLNQQTISIYNLNVPNPACINEVGEAVKFFNPHKFVELGIMPVNIFIYMKKPGWEEDTLQERLY